MKSLVIVYRLDGCFFSPTRPDEARGLLPLEAWVFGSPLNDEEEALWWVVQPVLRLLSRSSVHVIDQPARHQLVRGMPADLIVDEVAFVASAEGGA